jgi:hypothetical protein
MRARAVLAAGTVVMAALVTAPAAWALCPNCLGQSSALSSKLKLIGVFLLVPPAIFLVVTIAIRRLARRERR